MNVYRLISENYESSIDYSNSPIMENLYECKWSNIDDISSFIYKWVGNNGEFFNDCPFIIGTIPVFSEKMYNCISDKYQMEDTQAIKINVEGNRFVIVNTFNVVNDLLNKKKSDISYFPDGRIMRINNFVFKNKKELPLIFKIPETNINTFVNEELANFLKSISPKGLIIEKCKVVSGIFNLPF